MDLHDRGPPDRRLAVARPGAVNVAPNSTVSVGFDQAVTGSDDRRQGRRGHDRRRFDCLQRVDEHRDVHADPGAGPRHDVHGDRFGCDERSRRHDDARVVVVQHQRALARGDDPYAGFGRDRVALGTTVSVGFDRAVDSGSTAFQVVAGSTPVAGSLR